MPAKIVLAGNYDQYLTWLRENNVSHRDAIYADSEQRLRGLEFSERDIVRTGWYWKSPVSEAFLRSRIWTP